MKDFSAAALVPNRSNRPSYSVSRGAQIEDGKGGALGAAPVDGMVIAIDERVDHTRRTAQYGASTAEHFAALREANPHLEMTAWFFRRQGTRWEFIGFGESPESLWAEGAFAQP